jgi:hypothetical protein
MLHALSGIFSILTQVADKTVKKSVFAAAAAKTDFRACWDFFRLAALGERNFLKAS